MKIKVILVVIASIFISSCSSYEFKYHGNAQAARKMKRIGLLNVHIFPPKEIVPAILTIPIYDHIYEIIPLVKKINKFHSDSAQSYMANKMEQIGELEVLFGEKLYSQLTPEILDSLGLKSYPPLIRHNFLPFLELPENTLNIFDLSSEETPNLVFASNKIEQQEKPLSNLCQYLNLDGLVLAHFQVITKDFADFSDQAERILFEKILYFDNDGKRLFAVMIKSNILEGSGNDPYFYQEVLQQYYKYTDAFLHHFYLNQPYEKYLDQ